MHYDNNWAGLHHCFPKGWQFETDPLWRRFLNVVGFMWTYSNRTCCCGCSFFCCELNINIIVASLGVTIFNYAYVLQNQERFSSVSQRGFDLDPTLVDILLILQVHTKNSDNADSADCVAAACPGMCVGIKSAPRALFSQLDCIRKNICAAYSLASSLVAYVTFTTAVSVSVLTVEIKRGREIQKTWDTVNKGAATFTHAHSRSL